MLCCLTGALSQTCTAGTCLGCTLLSWTQPQFQQECGTRGVPAATLEFFFSSPAVCSCHRSFFQLSSCPLLAVLNSSTVIKVVFSSSAVISSQDAELTNEWLREKQDTYVIDVSNPSSQLSFALQLITLS
jgi:hypothetical protein